MRGHALHGFSCNHANAGLQRLQLLRCKPIQGDAPVFQMVGRVHVDQRAEQVWAAAPHRADHVLRGPRSKNRPVIAAVEQVILAADLEDILVFRDRPERIVAVDLHAAYWIVRTQPAKALVEHRLISVGVRRQDQPRKFLVDLRGPVRYCHTLTLAYHPWRRLEGDDYRTMSTSGYSRFRCNAISSAGGIAALSWLISRVASLAH